VLTGVFFVVDAIIGIFLPPSHDMIAPLSEKEQALFMHAALSAIYFHYYERFIHYPDPKYTKYKMEIHYV